MSNNKEPLQTNTCLSELLLFQQNFLALVHAQVYRCQPPAADSVLKFQINFLSQTNDQINSMIAQLTDQLVNKKRHYELSLRDCFQKWLQTDYLCLLRINRFEVTKLSLFGFDIYVDPLEAVLQVLNRLESAKKIIIDSAPTLQTGETAENALQKGWDAYILYANHWKLSFNIYILKEYLRVGAKSFLRKDRQILFTGITNFYHGLLPALSAHNCTQLLVEMADLNNCLYYFHPSFNYFQFYSLLFPLSQNVEPVFACMREVAEKCLRTNILTPLLFGLLRHRQSFLRFIAEANSIFWLPYLNAIISGISINLKFRILQYQEILQIFEGAVQKAGLLGEIRTEEITGELEDGWRDAKEFFISAVKVGFNSGDVQTWKMIQFQTIGPRILSCIANGMLLNVENNQEKLPLYLQQEDDRLQSELQVVSSGKLNLNFIKSSLSELEPPVSTESQVYNLLRIVNLIQIGQHQNQYSLHFLMTSLIRIKYKMATVLSERVAAAAQKVNKMLFGLKIINFTLIRDVLLDFHSKLMPVCQIQSIVDLYYSSFEPKKCLSSLLHILCTQENESRNKYIITSLILRFVPHPNSNLTTIKTFEKCFTVKNELINVGYQTHSLISVFITEIIKGSDIVTKLLVNIIKVCPWITFSLLNFPINTNGQLQSFASWLIDTPKLYGFFCRLLKQSKGAVQSQEGNDLIFQLLYPNICDQIIKKINLTEQCEQLLTYSQLLMQIYLQYHQTGNNSRDLLSVYLFLLSHVNKQEQIQKVILSITRIAELAFQDKTSIWIASLIERKITGRTEGQTSDHHKTLKNVKNNIYFMKELQNKINQSNTDKNVYESLQIIEQKLAVIESYPQKQYSQQFIDCYRKISKLNLQQIRSILKEQSIVLVEQLKQLCIPTIKQEHLKSILMLIQSKDFGNSQNFILEFINLNADNYQQTINYAISQKKVEYLARNWFTRKLNSKLPQFLQLQEQSRTLFLKQMTNGLSTEQKQKISAEFFLQPSILQLYVEHMEGIQFLSLYNNANWRIVTDFFSRQLSNSKLPSTLLQYYQYVLITNQRNAEYEIISSKYLHIFSKFVALFICKIQSIFTGSVTKEELSLKSTNQLSSLNLIVSSFQLQQILAKSASLHKIMQERNIDYETGWVDILWKLNGKINQYFDGNVITPDFIHGFCLTNDVVYSKHQTVIGTVNIGIFADKYYAPKKYQKLTVKQIQGKKHTNQHFKIIFEQTDITNLKQAYYNIISQLIKTGILVKANKIIGFNYQNKPLQNFPNGESHQLYIAGCLQACLPQQDRYELEPLLQLALIRKRLSWQLLKSIDSEQYHYIKTILVESQIAKKELNFVYDSVPLVPNGEHLIVSDYNKEIYCNIIALRAIGERVILNINDFLRGYTCQTA